MQLRSKGPLPALVCLFTSAVLLVASLNVAADANLPTLANEPADSGLLAWSGALFAASLAAGVAALAFSLMQSRRPLPAPSPSVGGLAPAVELVATTRDFVLRLHAILLTTGGLVLLGGLGLISAASLFADGTATGPFDIPGKIGVVQLNAWQVHVTLWAFVQLGIALLMWGREYGWARRLRRVWAEPFPEV